MKLIALSWLVVLGSVQAKETTNAAAFTDVAMQLSRFTEEGKSEEFYLYCPPKGSDECGVAKSVESVQVATGRIKRAEAKKIAERFIDDLPNKDISKGKEPAALTKSAQTAYLWQAKSGTRWTKGNISHEDSRNPAGDDGNQRKRLLALHALQTRLSSFLTEIQ